MKYKIIKIFVLITVLTGFSWFMLRIKNKDTETFLRKERCASYTQKRRDELNKNTTKFTSYEGFYSSVANTCITIITETVLGDYNLYVIVDELTGKTEFWTLESVGNFFESLTKEQKEAQFKLKKSYEDKLKYFRGN